MKPYVYGVVANPLNRSVHKHSLCSRENISDRTVSLAPGGRGRPRRGVTAPDSSLPHDLTEGRNSDLGCLVAQLAGT